MHAIHRPVGAIRGVDLATVMRYQPERERPAIFGG
jgi:hypothetical protein